MLKVKEKARLIQAEEEAAAIAAMVAEGDKARAEGTTHTVPGSSSSGGIAGTHGGSPLDIAEAYGHVPVATTVTADNNPFDEDNTDIVV